MPSLPRFLRRGLRRLLPPPGIDFIHSPAYTLGHSAVPTDPLRGERILDFLESEGLLRPGAVQQPRPAAMRSLRRVHTDDYLESLGDEEVLTRVVGVGLGPAEADRLLRSQRVMVGGTNLAARRALQSGRIAVNLGGGLHHAWADRGQGFCLLNDVAVAVAAVRAHGFEGRILVVDLDLHHGDGTEGIFAEDSTVYTYSIHNRDWTDIEAVASTRIELGFGVGDETYLAALRESLPPVVETFEPQLAFYLAGCDPAEGDAIGDWRISAEAMLERDLFVLSLLREGRDVPVVVCLAGGYGTEAWSYSARFFATLLNGGRRLDPPSTDEITLLHYRQLARRQNPHELNGSDGDGEDWGLTEEDVLGSLAGSRQPTRFLDFYTLHGLELVLERYGIFERLRGMGFAEPCLAWNLDDSSGQTLWIYGDPEHRELLGELRVRRDRRLLPGMETLHVEWLLMQNPRISFPPGRRALPGQEHPGLGMLRDIVALLLIACERLRLDGLSFVPSHFHLAVTGSKLMWFLDPVAEVRLEAATATLAELPLAQASAAVEAGRVVDRESGEPYRWQPTTLVLPVSEALETFLDSPDRQHARRLAREAAPAYLLKDGSSGEGARLRGPSASPPVG